LWLVNAILEDDPRLVNFLMELGEDDVSHIDDCFKAECECLDAEQLLKLHDGVYLITRRLLDQAYLCSIELAHVHIKELNERFASDACLVSRLNRIIEAQLFDRFEICAFDIPVVDSQSFVGADKYSL
jgi:hypothetical protein